MARFPLIIIGHIAKVRESIHKALVSKSGSQRSELFLSTDSSGKSLLHLAVEWKSEELIDMLLRNETGILTVKLCAHSIRYKC